MKLYIVLLLMLPAIIACKQNTVPAACQNVTTYAEDPTTGECKIFETNCTPEGWHVCEPVVVIEEPGTQLDRESCKSDDDCVCGGIDAVTNNCFIGNREYYNEYVDKSKSCPDFCRGIASNLVLRCLDGKCRQISKLQDQLTLCNRTGLAWTECGSGCGPLRVGDEIGMPRICQSVCVPMCRCPANKPFWDDNQGCVAGTDQEVSNSCKSDEDCILGINIKNCCDCPGAYSIKKILYESSLVEYVPGEDYSEEITVDCSAVQCEACPSILDYAPKCVEQTCQLVKSTISKECEHDAGCVPNRCCHPNDCVPLKEQPNCEDVICTMSCEGPLDCGAGSCKCAAGDCVVVASG